MKPKKFLTYFFLTILALALIGPGGYMEVYYYHFRFTSDGMHTVVAWLFGSALTVLLTALFIKTIFNQWYIFLAKIVLISISVFSTVSAQNYSYNLANNKNSSQTAIEENITKLYKEYEKEVNDLTIKIEKKESLLPDNLRDRAMLNTNGVQPLLDEIAGLEIQRKEARNKRDTFLLERKSSNQTEIKMKTAYELLAEDLNLNSPTLLKLLTQALLSLCMALMAPTGVVILLHLYNFEPVKVKKKKESNAVSSEEIEIKKYSVSRFRGQQNPSTLKGREEVIKETGLKTPAFHKLDTLAKKLNLIKTNGNITVPLVPLNQFVRMMIAEQPYKQPGLKAVQVN